MTLPWLRQNSDEVPAEQLSSGHIAPPKYDRTLDFRTIDTMKSRRDARYVKQSLVDRVESKVDSEASKALDDFCEENIVIQTSDGDTFPPSYGEQVDLELALRDKRLKNNFISRGVKKLNPLQRKTLPLVRLGESLILQAPTGIGKTYAFLIPAIELALQPENRSRGEKPAPCVIILSNASPLANQTFDRCARLLGIDQSQYQNQREQTKRFELIDEVKIDKLVSDHNFTVGACDIASATMGKLKSMIAENRMSLDNLKMIIFDEADRMIDHSSFGVDVEFVFDNLPEEVRKNVQLCFFSATYITEETEEGQELICLSTLQQKMLAGKEYNVLVCPRMGGYITQRVIKLPRPRGTFETTDFIVKMCKLRALIDQDLAETGCTKEGPYKETMIVFCETTQRVTQVAAALRLLGYNFKPMSSKISKVVQSITHNELATYKIQGIVCTNIMARGVDIGSIKHTVVMEMSREFDSYTHRIGRVGRDGSGGKATVIIDYGSMLDGHSANIIEQLTAFLKKCKQEVPSWLDKWYLERRESYRQAMSARF